MDDYVELAIVCISRVVRSKHYLSRAHSRGHRERDIKYWLVLVAQLKNTSIVLAHLKELTDPSSERCRRVHQELYRAVAKAASLFESPWDVIDEGVPPAATQEYLLEILLDVRWWTWVSAWRAGKILTSIENYEELFPPLVRQLRLASVPDVVVDGFDVRLYPRRRHLPSYEYEIWQQTAGTEELFREKKRKEKGTKGFKVIGDKDSEVKELLTKLRSTGLTGHYMEEMEVDFVQRDSKPPLLQQTLTIDLTEDLLGFGLKGWVIKIRFAGKEWALKRIDYLDTGPPVLARLWHPHIVNLDHYWQEGEHLFLIMELMQGDLAELLASEKHHRKSSGCPLSLPVAVDVMLQVAKGMLYLHDLGFSHPDLKCTNILFKTQADYEDNGRLTIKLGGLEHAKKTNSESMRKDVFLFGLFCLEVLTGNVDYEDAVAEMWACIVDSTSPILKQCVASCFDSEPTFSEIITLLLLAQLEILQSRNHDAVSSTANAHLEPELPMKQDLVTPSGAFLENPDDWKRTWTTRVTKELWPQTWLPEDLNRRSRVLSVSYDAETSEVIQDITALGRNLLQILVIRFYSKIFFMDSVGQIISSNFKFAGGYRVKDVHIDMPGLETELRLNPRGMLQKLGKSIVLVGHSFGGLVIKSLIVEAQNFLTKHSGDSAILNRVRNFLDRLKGVVFYSVPHSATDCSTFEQYIIQCSKSHVLSRSSLLQLLMQDVDAFTQQMVKLSSRFHESIPEHTEVLAFVEGKRMIRQQIFVAQPTSQQGWTCFRMDKDNHFEVCRPDSKEHGGYKMLVHALRRYIDHDVHLVPLELPVKKAAPYLPKSAQSSQMFRI